MFVSKFLDLFNAFWCVNSSLNVCLFSPTWKNNREREMGGEGRRGRDVGGSRGSSYAAGSLSHVTAQFSVWLERSTCLNHLLLSWDVLARNRSQVQQAGPRQSSALNRGHPKWCSELLSHGACPVCRFFSGLWNISTLKEFSVSCGELLSETWPERSYGTELCHICEKCRFLPYAIPPKCSKCRFIILLIDCIFECSVFKGRKTTVANAVASVEGWEGSVVVWYVYKMCREAVGILSLPNHSAPLWLPSSSLWNTSPWLCVRTALSCPGPAIEPYLSQCFWIVNQFIFITKKMYCFHKMLFYKANTNMSHT